MKARLAVAACVLVILAATLPPDRETAREAGGPSQVFGDRWLADAILNVILFAPLGLALGATRAESHRLILGAALFSAAIEAAQGPIPGRDPSVVDVVTNTIGAALGLALWRGRRWYLDVSSARAGKLAVVASLAASGVVATTGVLIQPSYPHSIYYGQWTPDLGHLEWYRGRVLGASLGDLPLPGSRLDVQRSERVRSLLAAGAQMDVRAVAGPATSRLGSLVSIYDERQREIMLLGPMRQDMVLREHTRAVGIGLDNPPLRWHGVLSTVRRGDTVGVRVRPARGGTCLAVAGREDCGVAHRVSDGWALLSGFVALSDAPQRALSAVWLALLVLPVGLWLRRGWAGALAIGVLGAGVLLVPRAVSLAQPAWWEMAALAAGLASGVALQRSAHSLGAPPRSAPASADTHRSMRS